MSNNAAPPNWLPPLLKLADFGGVWITYLDALYDIFRADFLDEPAVYSGRRIGIKRHPLSRDKEATFWHLITEGDDEQHRNPDPSRCERIRWIKPIIERDGNDADILSWTTVKKGENRIHLWFKNQDYVVVLSERKGYLILWTAFVVKYGHKRRKLQNEFERYQKQIGGSGKAEAAP